MVFALTVLGVILILEGLPYFAFPSRVKEWALMMQDLPGKSLRVMGLVSMAMGLALLYLARFL